MPKLNSVFSFKHSSGPTIFGPESETSSYLYPSSSASSRGDILGELIFPGLVSIQASSEDHSFFSSHVVPKDSHAYFVHLSPSFPHSPHFAPPNGGLQGKHSNVMRFLFVSPIPSVPAITGPANSLIVSPPNGPPITCPNISACSYLDVFPPPMPSEIPRKSSEYAERLSFIDFSLLGFEYSEIPLIYSSLISLFPITL